MLGNVTGICRLLKPTSSQLNVVLLQEEVVAEQERLDAAAAAMRLRAGGMAQDRLGLVQRS